MKDIIRFVDENLTQILENKFVQSIIIIAIAYALTKIVKKIIKKTIHKHDMTSRIETIMRMVSKGASFIIFFFAALQICQVLFNVQPTSIIAATGVIGVAVGFGAQSLVKDIISGFFILMEDQFAVGDLVTLEGFNGNVKELTLRTTIVKNIAGDLFIIPNGSITRVINHSRSERGVGIVVSIAYEEDISRALKIMQRVAEKAKEEMEILTQVPDVLGVTALGSSGVELKMFARCVVGEQFTVERELLKRIKYEFDAENVNIPYNHMVIVNKEDN